VKAGGGDAVEEADDGWEMVSNRVILGILYQ